MAAIKPFTEPQIVPPSAVATLANLRPPILSGVAAPGSAGVIPPQGALPPLQALLSAAEPPIDPNEQYVRDIGNIQSPVFTPYKTGDSIKPITLPPTPEFDFKRQSKEADKAARLAAIVQGISALAGAGRDSTQIAANAGLGYFNGADDTLQSLFKSAQADYNAKAIAEEKRYGNDVRLLADQNKAIDQGNDNARMVYRNLLDSADRQYSINSANERSREDRLLKANKQAQDYTIAQQKAKESKLRQFIELAKTNLLTPSGEAEAAKVINDLSGSGFSSDFLLSMTPEDKAKLSELALSREQKAALAEKDRQARLDIAKGHDQALQQRQKDASAAMIRAKEIDAEARKAVAAMKSKLGPNGTNEVKVRLQALSALSGAMQRSYSNATRYEKMAQDVLKNPDNEGRRSDPMGLKPQAYEEYQRLRKQAQVYQSEAEGNREIVERSRDDILGYIRGERLFGDALSGSPQLSPVSDSSYGYTDASGKPVVQFAMPPGGYASVYGSTKPVTLNNDKPGGLKKTVPSDVRQSSNSKRYVRPDGSYLDVVK